MAIEDLHSFRTIVDGSPQLQEEIAACVADGDLDQVVTLGKRHGLHFSVADLKAVFDDYASAELSDAELEAVVGGAGVTLSSFEKDLMGSIRQRAAIC